MRAQGVEEQSGKGNNGYRSECYLFVSFISVVPVVDA